MAPRAAEGGDDGTYDVIVSDVIRRLEKFWSEITLCCKSMKTQGKFRGWVLGTEFATGW